MIYPIIMAGGSGSRLWPLSRGLYPKQFISFDKQQSMLQSTLRRLESLECEKPIIVCNENHRFIVAEQLRQLDALANNIILEPFGRNTAPAIALAALTVLRDSSDDNPLILVLSADHDIKNDIEFTNVVRQSIKYASEGRMVTFGVIPSSPETGYGYILRGDEVSVDSDNHAYLVERFIEKPDSKTAQEFISDGNYLWNSGMFLFSASRYLEELGKYRPDILKCCKDSIDNKLSDLDFIRVDEDCFNLCPSESVDYAVMEHTSDAVVVPMSAGWSDVGSWASLWENSEKDKNGNVVHGDVIEHDTSNSYIYSQNSLIATVGVKDLVIVQTSDALLVAERQQTQAVKDIVDKIKADGRTEHFTHQEVYRPWGKCDQITSGERYQVKRITVKPGEALSLQMHYHRAEHWIIVAGTAKVTIGDDIKILSENESIYIPLGTPHCLENPGKISLDLIEVRSGSYLEEDDVIRFNDRYGRV